MPRSGTKRIKGGVDYYNLHIIPTASPKLPTFPGMAHSELASISQSSKSSKTASHKKGAFKKYGSTPRTNLIECKSSTSSPMNNIDVTNIGSKTMESAFSRQDFEDSHISQIRTSFEEHTLPYLEHRIPYEEHKAPYEEHRSYKEHRPHYEVHRLAYAEHRLPYEEHRLSYEEHRLPYEEHRLPYEEHRLPYEDHKLLYENRRLPYEDHRLSYGEHRSPYKESKSSYKEPRSPYKEPRSPYKEPKSPYKELRSYKEPRSPYKESRSPYKESRSSYKESKSSYKLHHEEIRSSNKIPKHSNSPNTSRNILDSRSSRSSSTCELSRHSRSRSEREYRSYNYKYSSSRSRRSREKTDEKSHKKHENLYQWINPKYKKKVSSKTKNEMWENISEAAGDGDFEEVEVASVDGTKEEIPVGFRKYRVKYLRKIKGSFFKPKLFYICPERTVINCLNLEEDVQKVPNTETDVKEELDSEVVVANEEVTEEKNVMIASDEVTEKENVMIASEEVTEKENVMIASAEVTEKENVMIASEEVTEKENVMIVDEVTENVKIVSEEEAEEKNSAISLGINAEQQSTIAEKASNIEVIIDSVKKPCKKKTKKINVLSIEALISSSRAYRRCIPENDDSYDFYQAKAIIQKDLDEWNSHMIGLSYIVEVRDKLDDTNVIKHHCALCMQDIHAENDSGEMVISHVTSFKHMFNYLVMF